MEMPMGTHKGTPLNSLPTKYLAWLVSQDAIRHSRWSLIEEVLRVLRDRFANEEALAAELRVEEAPPEHWKTVKRDQQRAAERAEKLRQLEERRRQGLREGTRQRVAGQVVPLCPNDDVSDLV